MVQMEKQREGLNKHGGAMWQPEQDLFNASTEVTIGDGKTALLWTSRWIENKATKNIPPTLYAMAIPKKITIEKELRQNKGVDHITLIHSQTEIHWFVHLWEAIIDVEQNIQHEDSVKQKWTADEDCTTKSAYQIQFKVNFRRSKLY